MDERIKHICTALKAEATAVNAYTECLRLAKDADEARTYAINRLDATEHIQNLTLALSNILSGNVGNTEGGVENE